MKSNKVYVGRETMIKYRICDLVKECLKKGWSTVELDKDWKNSPDASMVTKKEPDSAPEFFTATVPDSEAFRLFVKMKKHDADFLFRFFVPRLITCGYAKSNYLDSMFGGFYRLLSGSGLMRSAFSDYVSFDIQTFFSASGLLSDSYLSNFSNMSTIVSDSALAETLKDVWKSLSFDEPWLDGKRIGVVINRCFIAAEIHNSDRNSDSSENAVKVMAVMWMSGSWTNCYFEYSGIGNYSYSDKWNISRGWRDSVSIGINTNLSSDFHIDYLCVPVNLNFLNSSADSVFPSRELLDSDYRRVKLPVMPESKLKASSEGLSELFWNDSNRPDEKYYFPLQTDVECVARDPWELVRKNSSVAIDFGTSSTVVAVKNEHSHVDVVRMGSFDKTVEQSQLGASQYENPTVLNFIDFNAFMKAWTDVPYRPDTDYCSLQFSHDARAQLKDRPRSCMTSIKTWCRSDNEDLHVRLSDEQNFDFEIEHQKLSEDTDIAAMVDAFRDRGFDPVEVYAYLLGCSINNQSLNNGSIFLNYYMTFPVKFDISTKARIMEGFRRGLARSLPPSLVYSEKWKQQCSSCAGNLPLVEEIASEPITLAASFLEALDIDPADDGVPFGVFDFGGGTTDFAVGIYRNATEAESDDYGYETMLDILDASGDQDLGGEHLVDMLSFEVICENIGEILKNRINFILPHGFNAIPGSETVWSGSSCAYENFSMLSSRLRSLWESAVLKNEDDGSPETSNPAQLNIMFKTNKLNEEGRLEVADKSVAVSVDQERLKNLIRDRIKNGFERFLSMVKSAVDVTGVQIESLHVIASGNSCHSPLACEILREYDGITRDGIKLTLHSELLGANQQKYEEKGDLHNAVENAETKVKAAQSRKRGRGSRSNTAIADETVDKEVQNQSAAETPDYALRNPLLTLKTGVALGIFKLLRGETLGFVERNKTGDGGEAPFNFYVGKFVRGCFSPVLQRNSDYHTWIKFDRVRKTLRTRIAWTSDPTVVSQSKKEGDTTSCFIDHKQEHEGRNIFIRPETTHSIRVGISSSQEPENMEEELVIEL